MTKNKRAFFREFKKQFKEAWSYLGESKNYFVAVIAIFCGGIILGFSLSSHLSFLEEILKELLGRVEELGTFELILFILQNNLKTSFYGMALGILLGIFPVMTSFFNGVVLGYVMKSVWLESGISKFWMILPHGVFELPAVFVSLALGLKLGMFIFSRDKGEGLMKQARNSMIIFVCVIIPLLIVAAIIEGLLISLYRGL